MNQFREFDHNGDGTITKAELRRVLQRLDSSWSEKRLSQLIKTVDKNGDGLIQFEEFVSWIWTEPDQARAVVSEEALKSASAVLNIKSRTAHSAAKAGDFGNVLRLVREQPDIVNMCNNGGDTFLHQAALRDCAGAIPQLLEMKADPTLTNKAGHTPLQVAVEHSCSDSADALRRPMREASKRQAVPPDDPDVPQLQSPPPRVPSRQGMRSVTERPAGAERLSAASKESTGPSRSSTRERAVPDPEWMVQQQPPISPSAVSER